MRVQCSSKCDSVLGTDCTRNTCSCSGRRNVVPVRSSPTFAQKRLPRFACRRLVNLTCLSPAYVPAMMGWQGSTLYPNRTIPRQIGLGPTRVQIWPPKLGLGITAHAGEFSTANIAAALRLPGIKRIGHGVHTAATEELLQLVLDSGVTVECCLTSNVVLGAVPSLGEHPIRLLVEAGVPVSLSTDDPVRLCTTIEREYEVGRGPGTSAWMTCCRLLGRLSWRPSLRRIEDQSYWTL